MKPLVDYIGKPALLEQTAEECLELAFACLKLARYMRGENKVHGRTMSEMVDSIHEEIADVGITIDELVNAGMVHSDTVWTIEEMKRKRMAKRFKECDGDACDIEWLKEDDTD